MASGSATPDPRRVSRRDSSPRTGGRRPRLLRAAATEPSITTSNASRNTIANSQTSRRALDMLSRVAIISGSPPDPIMRSATPISTPPMSPLYTQQGSLSTSPLSTAESLEKIRPHHCSSLPSPGQPFPSLPLTYSQTPDGITASRASTSTKLASRMRRKSRISLHEDARLRHDPSIMSTTRGTTSAMG